MVEAGANELPEDMMLEALKLAHESKQAVDRADRRRCAPSWARRRPKSRLFLPPARSEGRSRRAGRRSASQTLLAGGLGKVPLNDGLDAVRSDVRGSLCRARGCRRRSRPIDVGDAFEAVLKKATRQPHPATRVCARMAATRTTIRPISVQVGCLPRVHGSGLFMRGETQVLTIATLGTPGDAQRLDTLQPGEEKRYMHHYNFPPFSTGEAYPDAWPQAPRDRARRAGRAGVGAGDPRGLPVHAAPGLRSAEQQRLDQHGLGLRQHAGADGCRCADHGAGGGHRHGPDPGRGDGRVPGAERHPGHGRCTWATWTSRSPAPSMASPPCRWTSRSRAWTSRSCARRWSRRAKAACTSWARCWRCCPSRART